MRSKPNRTLMTMIIVLLRLLRPSLIGTAVAEAEADEVAAVVRAGVDVDDASAEEDDTVPSTLAAEAAMLMNSFKGFVELVV
jgi:hypothetical protein